MRPYPDYRATFSWIEDDQVAAQVAFHLGISAFAGVLAIAMIALAPASVFSARRSVGPSLRVATTIFRRIGWGGIVFCATIYSIVLRLILSRPESQRDQNGIVMITIWFGLHVLAFASMFTTANRLEIDSSKAHGRARWTAILLGTYLFPVLTIPLVFAVRRLEKHRRELT